jgi:pimeloyl-ACP methyl ester carboxylesterase
MISFFHANGIPSRAYQQFFEALTSASGHTVNAPEVLSDELGALSGPMHWPAMRARVAAVLEAHGAKQTSGQPLYVLGHSMGGYLSLMAAQDLLERGLVTSQDLRIVLIDSPIVMGWRASVFGFSKLIGTNYRVGPAPIAMRRRTKWASFEQAKEFFSAKAFVRNFAPGVLEDYLAAILRKHPEGGVTLTVPGPTEAHIYANLLVAETLKAFHFVRAKGVRPLIVSGSHSAEVRMAGLRNNQALFGADLHELPTGHLIPLEQPSECAALVTKLLLA